MAEVGIEFERENLSGVVAVGTYLIDAAKRLGIRFESECIPLEDIHFCRVEITNGSDLLSEPTRLENESESSTEGRTGSPRPLVGSTGSRKSGVSSLPPPTNDPTGASSDRAS